MTTTDPLEADPLTVDALSAAVLEPGSVALVGGGPGALDLITVRGLALLRQADVAMYAVPTHAKLSKALNSPAMVGSAVAMIEISIEARSTLSMRAPSTIHS